MVTGKNLWMRRLMAENEVALVATETTRLRLSSELV